MSGPSKALSRPAIRRPLAVFRHRAFLIFWLGACVSNMGNWTENAAQSWAVTSQTIGNPHQGLYVEFLQFADFCPVLLLALIAGVISDRVNRKIWLITLQSLASALGAGLAIAAYLGRATPWVVITFTFLEGIIWALNGPVFLSVVPSLVPRAEMDRAIALNSVQFNMARLCGPMLAAGPARRDATRSSVRGFSNPLHVSSMGAAPHARRAADRDGCLCLRARAGN
jgi:MFS family permease